MYWKVGYVNTTQGTYLIYGYYNLEELADGTKDISTAYKAVESEQLFKEWYEINKNL